MSVHEGGDDVVKVTVPMVVRIVSTVVRKRNTRGHPKGILGDALHPLSDGGSAWSGPMALYNAISSGFIGISICPV
jgi:hypothetical protein